MTEVKVPQWRVTYLTESQIQVNRGQKNFFFVSTQLCEFYIPGWGELSESPVADALDDESRLVAQRQCSVRLEILTRFRFQKRGLLTLFHLFFFRPQTPRALC